MRTVPSHIGRYAIERWLGAGTFGDVFKGRDQQIERDVAIKLIRDEADDASTREFFVREARAAGRLRHVYIVTIYELGEHQGRPFIAMEFVDGETMGQLIRRRAPIALDRKLQIMAALCEGLGHAHKAGVIHRDIKPANVMMDPAGVIKVVDFGIARIGSSSTLSMIAGTWSYMSPEQITGQPLDHRSDVFAVGAVFYELLTLRKAFPGGPHDGITHKIVNESPEPIRQFCPDIDPLIEEIVARALEKDQRRRYQELEHMRDDIIKARRRLEPPDEPTQLVTPLTERRTARNSHLVALRGQRIEQHLKQAQQAFDSGNYDAAIAEANEAALLDGEDQRAFDLINNARVAQDERLAKQWLGEARDELTKGHLTAAADLIERALSLSPAAQEGSTLRLQILDTRRELERRRSVRRSMDAARRSFQEGGFEAAIEHAKAALELDATLGEALTLLHDATDALEERRRREEHERRANEAMATARQRFIAGEHDAALTVLREFAPEHPGVSELLRDLTIEYEEIERLRREEEARRERERQKAVRRALEEARTALLAGNLEQALASADAAAALEPDSIPARDIRQNVLVAIEQRRVQRAIEQARRQFAAGDHQKAIAALETFSPRDAVSAVVQELTSEHERIIRRQKEEEETRRRAESVRAAIVESRAALAAGDLDRAAAAAAKASAIDGRSAEAREAAEAVRTAQAAAALARAVRSAIADARGSLSAGDLQGAARRAAEAVRLDPASPEVQEVQAAVNRAIEAKRRQEELERRVDDVITTAEREYRQRGGEAALQILTAFAPAHPRVTARLEELTRRVAEDRLKANRAAAADLTRRARSALAARDFDGALELLERAQPLDPNAPDLQELMEAVKEARAHASVAASEAVEPAPAGATESTTIDRPVGRETASAVDEQAETLPPQGSEAEVVPATQLLPVPTIASNTEIAGATEIATVMSPAAAAEPAARGLATRGRLIAAAGIMGAVALAAAVAMSLQNDAAEPQTRPASPDTSQVSAPPASPSPPPATPSSDSSQPRDTNAPPSAAPSSESAAGGTTADPDETARAEAAAVGQIRSTAQAHIKANRRDLALKTILSGLSRAPADRTLAGMLGQMVETARQEAQNARSKAVAARAQELASQSFQDGAATLQQGAAAERERRPDRAVPLYWAATDALNRAAIEAGDAAAEQKARADAADKERLQREEQQRRDEQQRREQQQRSEKTAEPPAPAKPPPSVAENRPAPPPPAIDETAAIRQALNAYESAWSKMDVAALARVQTLSPDDIKSVQRAFSQARDYQVSVEITEIKVAPDGRQATVGGRVSRAFNPRAAGGRQTMTIPTRFTLEKRAGGWVIVSVASR